MTNTPSTRPDKQDPMQPCCGDHTDDGGRPCNGCPESPNVPALSGAGVGRVEAYAEAIDVGRVNANLTGEGYWAEVIALADSEQAVLVARVAELEAEVATWQGRAANEHSRCAVTIINRELEAGREKDRADAAEATLAKVAALADELRSLAERRDPTHLPHLTMENHARAMGRVQGINLAVDRLLVLLDGASCVALASAGRPATSDGEDSNGEAYDFPLPVDASGPDPVVAATNDPQAPYLTRHEKAAPPFRPDPDLITTVEGDWKGVERTKAKAHRLTSPCMHGEVGCTSARHGTCRHCGREIVVVQSWGTQQWLHKGTASGASSFLACPTTIAEQGDVVVAPSATDEDEDPLVAIIRRESAEMGVVREVFVSPETDEDGA